MESKQGARVAAPKRDGAAEPQTREALLEAAFHSAVRHGWARVRMGQVAGRAGVSRQTLYRHFRTKEGLALALALREQEAFLVGCQRAFMHQHHLFDAVRAAVTWSLKHRTPRVACFPTSRPGRSRS
jgi:AcrR family transcriptional regulator